MNSALALGLGVAAVIVGIGILISLVVLTVSYVEREAKKEPDFLDKALEKFIAANLSNPKFEGVHKILEEKNVPYYTSATTKLALAINEDKDAIDKLKAELANLVVAFNKLKYETGISTEANTTVCSGIGNGLKVFRELLADIEKRLQMLEATNNPITQA